MAEEVFHENLTICPVCQRENRSGVAACAFCGQVLTSSVTVIIPDKSANKAIQDQIKDLVKQHSDALLLLISGVNQPVLVKGDGKIILGRQLPTDTAPVLDLVKYGAQSLGVSRQHAMIRFSSGGFTIEDLNSTNGTSVNEIRLVPHTPRVINNGDMIRLGQLILLAYLVSTNVQPSLTQQIVHLVVSEGQPNSEPVYQALTVNHLSDQIVPYLQAIAQLQRVLDEVTGRSPRELGIRHIGVGKNDTHITVSLTLGAEALQFVRDKVMPQRAAYQAKLDAAGTVDDYGDETLHSYSQMQAVGDRAALYQMQTQLAVDLLAAHAPRLSSPEQQVYIDQLQEPLAVILSSALELAKLNR